MQCPLVIYHGGCDDGFAAAYIIHELHPDWEFYPGVYQQPPPETAGREVFLVDFSYKRPVIESMLDDCKKLTIIDHHKSAQNDLQGLEKHQKLELIFDMAHCGAMLTWKRFRGTLSPPDILSYIEDRDLWRKNLPDGDAVTFWIRSFPQKFEQWGEIFATPISAIISQGRSIARFYRQKVAELRQAWDRCPAFVEIGGHVVPVFNAPYFFASELAGDLSKGYPFAAVFWFNGAENVTYSLRSRGDFDVSKIAAQYGGGGHKNAAGFKVDIPPLPLISKKTYEA